VEIITCVVQITMIPCSQNIFGVSNKQRTRKIKIVKNKHCIALRAVNGKVFIARAVICLHGLVPRSSELIHFYLRTIRKGLLEIRNNTHDKIYLRAVLRRARRLIRKINTRVIEVFEVNVTYIKANRGNNYSIDVF